MDEPETTKELEMNLVREVEEEKKAVDLANNEAGRKNELNEERDVVLGDLPEDLQRLFVVGVNAENQLEKLHVDLQARIDELRRTQGELNERQTHDITTQHDIGHWRVDAIDEMFTDEVRKLFPQLKKGMKYGIRKGWKVVMPKEQPKAETETASKPFLGGEIADMLAVAAMLDDSMPRGSTLEVVRMPGGDRVFIGHQMQGEEFFDELIAGLVGAATAESLGTMIMDIGGRRQALRIHDCDNCRKAGNCPIEPIVRLARAQGML